MARTPGLSTRILKAPDGTVQVRAEEPEGVAVLAAYKRVQIGAEPHGGILVGIADCGLTDWRLTRYGS